MRLSIITINYNNCKGLQRTIDSVVSQTFRDFEWIVIDGGSTDGSKELIEQYANHFAYWVSEPDKGIYHAMNKGIKVAKGDYLQFLNSGDWLRDGNVLQDFANVGFSADIVDGDIHLIYVDREVNASAPESVGFDFFVQHGTIWHPCAFIKKTLFDRCGYYNEAYRIISDWEFFMKSVVLHSASYEHFKRIVACFPVDGISATNDKEQVEGVRESLLRIMPESALDAYMSLARENKELRKTKCEYDNLKNGRFGLVVKFLLLIKSIKSIKRRKKKR